MTWGATKGLEQERRTNALMKKRIHEEMEELKYI